MPRHKPLTGTSRRKHKRKPNPTLPARVEVLDELEGKRSTNFHKKNFDQPQNTFKRRVEGFSRSTMAMLLGDAFDEQEGIVVSFTGISQKPKKKSELNRTSVLITKSGILVLSGLVAPSFIEEIGRGNSSIRQLDSPILPRESFDGPRRLNVVVGTTPAGLNAERASVRLAEEQLVLSSLVEVNGRPIDSFYSVQDIDRLWLRPSRQQSDFDMPRIGW